MSNRGIFLESNAERFIDLAGQPYQPSNGTEGDIFMCAYCEDCRHSDPEFVGCEILLLTMAHSPGDDEYPKEWIYGKDGQPTCTKFEENI